MKAPLDLAAIRRIHKFSKKRTTEMAMERATEVGNKFFVGMQGEMVMIMRPVPQRMAKAEALNLAVWIVALAADDDEEWEKMLEAVRNT